MLKLKKYRLVINEIIKFDGCIPLSVQFNQPEIALLTWTCVFEDRSLLEIGLNKNSGALWEITLVSLKREHVNFSEGKSFRINDLQVKAGIPVFEVGHWPVFKNLSEFNQPFKEYFLREEHKIFLEISNDSASLWFRKKSRPSYYLKGHRVYFGIDVNDFLCRIDLADLNRSEINCLKKALDQSGGILSS